MSTDKKRTYNRVSTDKIAKFAQAYSKHGNGSKAVKYAYPELTESTDGVLATKASRMLKNEDVKLALAYIDNRIKQGALQAVDKVIEHIESDNDKTSLKASTYLIDHAIGKSVQRTESKAVNINIESVLE